MKTTVRPKTRANGGEYQLVRIDLGKFARMYPQYTNRVEELLALQSIGEMAYALTANDLEMLKLMKKETRLPAGFVDRFLDFRPDFPIPRSY